MAGGSNVQEREESVRLDILQAYVVMLTEVRRVANPAIASAIAERESRSGLLLVCFRAMMSNS